MKAMHLILFALAASVAAASPSAGLRRLPMLVVVEGASADVKTDKAVLLKCSNTAVASVSLPNDGASVVSGLRLGTAELTYSDHRGPYAAQAVTVVPSYWETILKFFEDDPEVSVSVSGDKVIVSGKTSSHETIRRVEQSKAFDPARILSQVTFSVPAIGATLQAYLRHIGHSNVTATAVGNEICLSGRLFDRRSISNVVHRAGAFLRDFPGVGVNADGLKVFNQRIVLDIELIQYDVTKAENLGIQWPSAISAEGKFTYGWSVSRNRTENSGRNRNSSRNNTWENSRTISEGTPAPAADGDDPQPAGNSLTDTRTLSQVLGDAVSGADSVQRGNEWKADTSASIDGVRMTVNLLKQNGVSKTLYKTSLATQSGEQTTFQSGGTIHRSTQGTFSGGDLKEIEYGFIIKSLPQILDDQTVALTVDLDNKQPVNYAPGSSSMDTDITVSRYQTRSQYMVRPGETILVSGFNRLDEADNKQGLPWFCRIPWIGEWLFGNTVTRNNTSEVVLVVTVNWAVEKTSEESVKRADELRDRKTEIGMP